MAVAVLNARDVVMRNYIPYARMTIVDRAIPDLRDGLKPVQRRILFSMHENNQYYETLNGKPGKSYKSARIVGDVMGKYHPHGDSSIYGALVNMTDDYDDLLVPYIHGDGTFGRVWSDSIEPSAMRYTEASLNNVARELFDGLSEDTIEMVPNFDETEMEPALLPVKFPTVLVGSTLGLAVGIRSNIPHYNLKSVCNAVTAIVKKKATTPLDLIDVLGAPDFTTGGYIHCSKENLLKLLTTGSAKFTLSGAVLLGKDRIVVKEIPYNTTIDKIEKEIKDAITNRQIEEIKDVINSSGYDSKKKIARMEMVIELKSGSDVKKVLAKLNKYTSLRTTISFCTRVLYGEENQSGRPEELGIFDLLCKWVEWRQYIIQRQYSYKFKKESDREHKLSAWEKVKNRLPELLKDLTGNTEEAAKQIMMSKYGLDDVQAEYLYEKKLRQITQDKLQKALKDLAECRALVSEYHNVVTNRKSRERLIIQQIDEIKNKYGIERKTTITDEIIEAEEEEKLAEIIPDMPVSVVISKNGYMKKFTNALDSLNAENLMDDTDSIKWDIECNNKDMLLVFTTAGNCYKVPVHKIDNSSKSKFKELVARTIGSEEGEELLYVTATRDYSGGFTVVYRNGKGIRVPLHMVSGKRSKYMNVFEPVVGGGLACTYRKFFIITKNEAAALADITGIILSNKKSKFNLARLNKSDAVIGVQPFEKVPGHDIIDYSCYQKGYAVKIKHPLWETPETEGKVDAYGNEIQNKELSDAMKIEL